MVDIVTANSFSLQDLQVHFYKPRTKIGKLCRYLTFSTYIHCLTEVDGVFLDISLFKKSKWYPSDVLDRQGNTPDSTITLRIPKRDYIEYLDTLSLTNRSFSYRLTCIRLSKELVYHLTGVQYKGWNVDGYKRCLEQASLA